MITRRWVLNGLIAAPAVIIAGRFMPPPARSPIEKIYRAAVDADMLSITELHERWTAELSMMTATGEMLDRWVEVYNVEPRYGLRHGVPWESDQSLRSRLIGHIG